MSQLETFFTLLLLTFLAPACAPNEPPPPAPPKHQNLVLLTDANKWKPAALLHLQDSLTNEGFRVITSGYPSETAEELIARLPWLLQPGVDLMLYDEALAGAAVYNSLNQQLRVLSPTTKLQKLR